MDPIQAKERNLLHLTSGLNDWAVNSKFTEKLYVSLGLNAKLE